MVRVFVAQTQDRERQAVCDFLEAAGYAPEPHKMTPDGQTWLGRELLLLEDPAILVTSQRDSLGFYYTPFLFHAFLKAKKDPTLTIVYTRAAAYPQYSPQVIRYYLDMWKMSTNDHKIHVVPKVSDATFPEEHELILDHIRDFSAFHSLPVPNGSK